MVHFFAHLDGRPHNGGMHISYLSVLVVTLALFCPTPGRADDTLKVRAMIIELPRSPPCKDRKIVRVMVLYRVERVLSGKLAPGQRLLVMHRCPRIPRGLSRHGRGEAGSMKPGQVHLMTLEPLSSLEGVLDRFSEHEDRRARTSAPLKAPGPARSAGREHPAPTRYRALVTDPAPADPGIVVVVSGGAGTNHRLEFDGTALTVGRAYTSDVLLNHRAVAPRHLRLVVDGDRISVRPLDPGRARVLINGKPITRPTKITYKDRIKVGGYELRVALFLTPRPEA